MTNLTLRRADNQDGENITRLVFEVLREHALTPAPEAADRDIHDIEAHYLARGGRFDVLQDKDGAIIGCVGLYPLDDERCELRKMYLKAEARGRGLGVKLLEHALTQARALGYTRMELETASVLERAVELYRRYGFKPLAREDIIPRCDQAWYLDLDETPIT